MRVFVAPEGREEWPPGKSHDLKAKKKEQMLS